MEPEISVIIPYYHGRQWLPRSLSSALGQEGVALEVIVVDDGSDLSPDDMPSPRSDPRLRLLNLPHGGKGAAVNAGVRIARGSLICILDQDDEMLPGRLAAQATILREIATIDAVYSDYERRDENGCLVDVFRSRQASREEMIHCLATSTGLFSIQTLLMRRRTLDRIGGFCPDDRITGFDDAEFFIRILAAESRLQYVPGVFARWTSHPSNYSKSARFHEARLSWIERLTALAAEHEILKKELPHFKAHNFTMRGMFFLEQNLPEKAVPEFAKAIRADWSHTNSYYLFVKSLIRSGMAFVSRTGQPSG